MNNYNSTFLLEKWSISRGRDTYGYNICTILDPKSGAKGRCNGGGYDMAGTSLAECLENMPEVYARLQALITIDNAGYVTNERTGGNAYFDGDKCREQGRLYGTGLYITKEGLNRVSIDGATGYQNVINIYKAAGVDITASYDRNKRNCPRLGWFVSYTN